MLSYNDDYRYAENVLSGTVVVVGDDVVLVNEIYDKKVHFTSLFKDRGSDGTCMLDDVTLESPTLGYVNNNKRCHYIFRTSGRQWYQGLTANVLSSTDGVAPMAQSPDVAKCILGIYPTYEECEEGVLCGKLESQAFSREFSISGGASGIDLAHKGDHIGTMSGGLPDLIVGKEHLKEKLSLVLPSVSNSLVAVGNTYRKEIS